MDRSLIFEKLNELEQQISSQHNSRSQFYDLIKEWCDFFGWTQKSAISGISFTDDFFRKKKIYRIRDFKYIKYLAVIAKKYPAFYALTSLAIAMIGAAINEEILIKQRNKPFQPSAPSRKKEFKQSNQRNDQQRNNQSYQEQEQRKNHRSSSNQDNNKRQRKPKDWTLVLVINAGKTLLINAIKKEGIHKMDPDELYRSTQSLWFGEKSEFETSDLASCFDESKKVTDENESEYDVYLIRLKLNNEVIGFHQDADDLDRMDAFESLIKNRNPVKISERLSHGSALNTYR